MHLVLAAALLFTGLAGTAQQPAETQAAQAKSGHKAKAEKTSSAAKTTAPDDENSGITEEELRRMLVGKPLFLRGGYISDSLSYGTHGELDGNAPPAPYTLCAVQIDKVHLSKRKVELVGARYGLHFLGALAYEDPTKAVDRVKITPKKRTLKITIERELVVKPKKVKAPKAKKGSHDEPAAGAAAEEAKTEAAANLQADPNTVAATISPAQSATALRGALDRIFADSIDERMIAAMPDFWKLYYQSAAAKTDYRPSDQTVLRQNMVDQKAKLISQFEPASNEYAQDHGVAGMSLYHVVIGADGKPGEISVARPIGFGLDENAVEAIRSAKFEPAMKDGKPVPVLLDLVVQFRIFSKRTAKTGSTQASDKPAEPSLPGPYSVQLPSSANQ